MNYVVIVKQPKVLIPRIYRVTAPRQPPLSELLAEGIHYVPERGDAMTIDAVSDALFDVVPGRWLEANGVHV